jgi:hypothetical protein
MKHFEKIISEKVSSVKILIFSANITISAYVGESHLELPRAPEEKGKYFQRHQ